MAQHYRPPRLLPGGPRASALRPPRHQSARRPPRAYFTGSFGAQIRPLRIENPQVSKLPASRSANRVTTQALRHDGYVHRSAIVGIIWTAGSPIAAFGFLAAAMAVSA